MGGAKKQGLKARFGHPNMCSTALGTFIGRFKNFAVDGDQVRADLFMSASAKETPHGNLYDYVLNMAKNEPDVFGTSIVFTPGRTYRRDDEGNKVIVESFDAGNDEPVFVECDALHACDAVDEPAANDGLFSKFSQETLAGQVTEFLDLHPEVFEAIQSNPSIVEALARKGEQMDEFITRYRAYREHNGKDSKMSDTPTNSEQLEEVVTEPSATETPESTEELETPAESESLETEPIEDAPAESDEELSQESTETEELTQEVSEVVSLSRDDFVQIRTEFGDEIAATVMAEGGDYDDAVQLRLAALDTENVQLRARVAELEEGRTGSPAPVSTAATKRSIFNCTK
jgi:hypothetical protein